MISIQAYLVYLTPFARFLLGEALVYNRHDLVEELDHCQK